MTARALPAPWDRGQAAPLMVVALAVALIVVLVTVEAGRLLHESAMARTAADAAALAGAAGGRAEAESVAAANGGVLVSYVEQRPEDDSEPVVVTVAVRVGRASESARAEALVEWTAPP